jgi:hypothetical protein
VNRWHSTAGIVSGIFPGKGVHYIRTKWDLSCCPPDPFCHSLVNTPGQGNVERDSKVDNGDSRILAERNAQSLSDIDIFPDVRILPTSNRVGLGCRGLFDHPQDIGRKPDNRFAVCPAGSIRKSIDVISNG